MIKQYVPPEHYKDDFYEPFVEQRARHLNHPNTTEEQGSFPFPIQPIQSTSFTDQRKRLDTHSDHSGVNCPLGFFSITSAITCNSRSHINPQSPSHLLHDQRKLLSQHQKVLLARFNNLFAIMPNCVP